MNLDIGETIFAKLKGLVPNNMVYPDVLEYDVKETDTYIIYKTDDTEIVKDISGVIKYANIGISIECYGKERDVIKALANSVIDALDNKSDESNNIKKITLFGNSGGYITDGGSWFETLNFDIFKIA